MYINNQGFKNKDFIYITYPHLHIHRDSLGTNYGLTSNGDGVDVNYHFIKQRFYASQNPYESFGGNNDAEDRFLGSRINLVSVPYDVVGEGFTRNNYSNG